MVHSRAGSWQVAIRLGERAIRADGEVLLCAGAIDSPRLLMLSGIGSADQLRSFGIPVILDLPDVGRHQDQPLQRAAMRR